MYFVKILNLKIFKKLFPLKIWYFHSSKMWLTMNLWCSYKQRYIVYGMLQEASTNCLVKYGFCKKLLRYKWTSDHLNTFFFKIGKEQVSLPILRKKVFNWSEVHLYRSNFLQNPYFSSASLTHHWMHKKQGFLWFLYIPRRKVLCTIRFSYFYTSRGCRAYNTLPMSIYNSYNANGTLFPFVRTPVFQNIEYLENLNTEFNFCEQ